MIGPPTLKVSTCSTLGIKLAPILATPSVVWSTSHNPWDVWNTPSIRPNKSRHGKLQPTWRQCGECDAWCCLRIKNWSSLRLNFEDQKTTPCYTGSFPSNWKVQGFCWGKVMARLHINLCEAQVSTHQMAELPLFLSHNFLRWEWSPWGLKSGARHIGGWDSWDSRGMFIHVYTISIWWVMQYLHLSKNVGDSWTTPPKHGASSWGTPTWVLAAVSSRAAGWTVQHHDGRWRHRRRRAAAWPGAHRWRACRKLCNERVGRKANKSVENVVQVSSCKQTGFYHHPLRFNWHFLEGAGFFFFWGGGVGFLENSSRSVY